MNHVEIVCGNDGDVALMESLPNMTQMEPIANDLNAVISSPNSFSKLSC
jgi:hypothetical protein